MQAILIEVAFRADEEVAECATEVFTKLQDVEHLDLEWELGVLGEVVVDVGGAAVAA